MEAKSSISGTVGRIREWNWSNPTTDPLSISLGSHLVMRVCVLHKRPRSKMTWQSWSCFSSFPFFRLRVPVLLCRFCVVTGLHFPLFLFSIPPSSRSFFHSQSSAKHAFYLQSLPPPFVFVLLWSFHQKTLASFLPRSFPIWSRIILRVLLWRWH